MDAALECSVEFFQPVRCQKEDSLVVFEESEEDGDECVAYDIIFCALAEEDICFVEEKNRVPCSSEIEYLF